MAEDSKATENANGRNQPDPLLTPEQVAKRLNVSPDWVRDHSTRKNPRLPVIRLGGGPGRAGLLRYRARDIERYIEESARLSERRLRAVWVSRLGPVSEEQNQ